MYQAKLQAAQEGKPQIQSAQPHVSIWCSDEMSCFMPVVNIEKRYQ
ncbi:hypothetical protein RRSWK_00284 [Rhodopirellula sp. SWK7]|nr:hypothetical protein RRSWK_00284 [Rhodopirellula sp. SWK7]